MTYLEAAAVGLLFGFGICTWLYLKVRSTQDRKTSQEGNSE